MSKSASFTSRRWCARQANAQNDPKVKQQFLELKRGSSPARGHTVARNQVHATNTLVHDIFTRVPSIEITQANRATPTALAGDPKKSMTMAARAKAIETRTYICSGA